MTTLTTEIDHDVLVFDHNLSEFTTVEDFAALKELPIGTRFLDVDGDEQIVTGYDAGLNRVLTNWQLHRSGSPVALDYDAPEALEQLLPAVVLNPEILGDFVAADHPFSVGDRVRLIPNPGAGIYSPPRGSTLGDEGVVTRAFRKPHGDPRLADRIAVEMDNGTTWDDLYVDRFELVPAPKMFRVGDRVELVSSLFGGIKDLEKRRVELGSLGVVTESDDMFMDVQFDNGQEARGWWCTRYAHSDVPAKAEPFMVQAECTVVLDVEGLHALPDGSLVGKEFKNNAGRPAHWTLMKSDGRFIRVMDWSFGPHSQPYDATHKAEADLREGVAYIVLYLA